MIIFRKSCSPITAFMGVDPGKTGAACLFCPSENRMRFMDWPKSDNVADVLDVLNDWSKRYTIEFAVLEKVASMPKQGVKSVFTFGMNFGSWKAILQLCQIPHVILTPQAWMKGLVTASDGSDSKSRCQAVFCRMFPSMRHLLFGPKDGYKDGRGDAGLMAYVASQQRKS